MISLAFIAQNRSDLVTDKGGINVTESAGPRQWRDFKPPLDPDTSGWPSAHARALELEAGDLSLALEAFVQALQLAVFEKLAGLQMKVGENRDLRSQDIR